MNNFARAVLELRHWCLRHNLRFPKIVLEWTHETDAREAMGCLLLEHRPMDGQAEFNLPHQGTKIIKMMGVDFEFRWTESRAWHSTHGWATRVTNGGKV